MPFGMPSNFFLIAKHYAMCKITTVNRPLVMWQRGGEAIYTPMNKSQSFSGPVPIDCELP